MYRAKVMQVIPLVDGIFGHMDYTFWDFTSEELDILLQSRIGRRAVAPLIDIIQGPPEDPCLPRPMLDDSQLTRLALIILKTFRPKWDRLGSLHKLDYDILKNYLDEYREVLKDDEGRSSSLEREEARQGSSSDAMQTTSGIEGLQQSVSSNDSSSSREDSFESTFARSSSESQTRTDNLSEVKDSSKSGSQLRTDDLLESVDNQSTNEKEIAGGDYALSKTRALETAGENTAKSEVYGFNSAVDTPVDDTDALGKTAGSESETIVESATGSKTETESITGDSSKSNTGTQEIVTNEAGAQVKTNTGTQAISDNTNISDSTTTTDSQTNESVSHGASSASNSSTTTTDTSSTGSTSEVSRLSDSAEVNRALNRARISIHRGNIGNLTPQQLITQEIELWRWNFINEVLDDIKSLITIPIYY